MPRAAGMSAVLHLIVILLLIFATWWSRRVHEKPQMEFELVAGPGTNYAALEAPPQTESMPTVELKLPDPPPKVEQPKSQPQPQVVQTPPPAPVPKPQPKEVKKDPAPPKIEKAPEKAPVKVEPAPERVSYKEFVAENGPPKTKPVKQNTKPVEVKKIDVKGVTTSITRVTTGGANGKAMTREESDLTDAYVALIRSMVNQSLERANINETREATVEFTVTLRGAIENVVVTRSSGSASFDRAVVASFKTVSGLGSPPTKRAERFSVIITMNAR